MEAVRGSIIEVPLSGTNETFPEGASAQCVVLHVSTIIAEVRSLGCFDAATETLFSRFNRKHCRLHICIAAPCTHGELENILHVTKMKLWTCRWEDCPVLTSLQKCSIRRYLAGPEEEEEPEEEKPGCGVREKPLREGKKPVKTRRKRWLEEAKRGRSWTERSSRCTWSRRKEKEEEEERKKGVENPRKFQKNSRQKLKASLAALRERLTGTRGAKAAGLADPIEDGSEESVVGMGSGSELEGLTTGTSMKAKERLKKDKKKEKEGKKPRKMAKAGRLRL